MDILVINGSPKGEKSNTLRITNAFLKGFPAGTHIETTHLKYMDISPCKGCFSCWSATPGRCVINDGMVPLYEKIHRADVIIESFPLYFFGMPSGMKAFTDRCLPFMMPYMGGRAEVNSFHEPREKSMLRKKFAVISSCGYVDANAMYPALIKQLDLICGEGRYTSIFCPEGEIFTAEKAARQREGYLADVTAAGEEFFSAGKISESTREKLAKPILSDKGFEAVTLAHWAAKSR